MDIIKEKQQLWAKRNKKNMRTDHKYYTDSIDSNIYNGLSSKTKEAFDKADGGELKGNPIPMTALHSSSALCVNVFQYFENFNTKPDLALEILKACKLIDDKKYKGKITAFEFECKRFSIKNDNKIISTPNIDVVIETKSVLEKKQIFAIESKFTEPYGTVDNFLAEKYYIPENESIWNSLGSLYESLNIDKLPEETRTRNQKTEKGKYILTKYKYLNALQLIKHLMGVRGKWKNKAQITLVYVWYDALGKEGFEHRNEIKEFRELIEKNTGIRFRDISYQELIYNLNKQLPYNEHKEYLNYITERYL